MDTEKIYTNLSFGFEIEVIGKALKCLEDGLSTLHHTIKKKLIEHILRFKLPAFPDFELNEIGELLDYENFTQVE